MRRLLLAGALAGCNWVYGIGDTHLEQTTFSVVDGGRVLLPPDGTAACPAPPDFDTWTFAPRAIPGITKIESPTFLAPDRVLFGANKIIYTMTLGQPPAPLTDIDPGDGSTMTNPAAAPGRELFWFTRTSPSVDGPFVALFDGNRWQTAPANLSLVAYTITPGAVGMYAGTARMVVFTNQPNDTVELASQDGVVWTDVAHFGTDIFAPQLSADGCWLFAIQNSQVTVRVRGSDGTFGAPAFLTAASAPTLPTLATLSPDGARLWVMHGGFLYEGHP